MFAKHDLILKLYSYRNKNYNISSLLTLKQTLWQSHFCVLYATMFYAHHLFGLIMMCHTLGLDEISQFTPSNTYIGVENNSPTMSKSTLDSPNNVCPGVLTTLGRQKVMVVAWKGVDMGHPVLIFQYCSGLTELQDAHTESCGYDSEHSDMDVENVVFRMEIRQ